jgi:drug/metabolite transporter (DMT)-like permease
MAKWIGYWSLTLIFGSGFLFINIASDQVAPIELTAARMVIATAILNVILWLRGQRIPSEGGTLRALAILGIINYAAPFTLIAWAQQQGVSSGLSGVLVATNPIFTLLIAHFTFADERINQTKLFGIFAGFFGVFILASRNFEGDVIESGQLMGQGAMLLAALCFAASNVYSRQVMSKRDLEPWVVGAATSLSGMIATLALLSISLMAGSQITDPATLDADTLIAVGILALIHSSVTFVLAKFVIRELGSSRMSTTTYIVPVFALILGAIFLDEVIDARVLFGTAIILSGIGIVNLNLSRFFSRGGIKKGQG